MDDLHTFGDGFGAGGTTRGIGRFARIEPLASPARSPPTLAPRSGATDAICFLALGSAFTSVVTGNLVLLGIGSSARNAA
jgi:Protein of unknown function (DUF1275)